MDNHFDDYGSIISLEMRHHVAPKPDITVKIPLSTHSRRADSIGISRAKLRTVSKLERARFLIPEVMAIAKAYGLNEESPLYTRMLKIAREAAALPSKGNGIPLTKNHFTYNFRKQGGQDPICRFRNLEGVEVKIIYPTLPSPNEPIAQKMAEFELLLLGFETVSELKPHSERDKILELIADVEFKKITYALGLIKTKGSEREYLGWREGLLSERAIHHGVPNITAECARQHLAKNKSFIKHLGGEEQIAFAPYSFILSERKKSLNLEYALRKALRPSLYREKENDHLLSRADRFCLARLFMKNLFEIENYLYVIAFGHRQHVIR